MGSFRSGFSAPLRVLRLLRSHARARRLVLVPIAINIALAALLYIGLLYAGLAWIHAWVAALPDWAQGLSAIFAALLVVVLLLVVGFVLVSFGAVLGSPFYGQLSELIERQVTGRAPPAEPLTAAGIARDLGRALTFELKKLIFSLAGLACILLIGLVPVVGPTLGVGLQIALSSTIACLDFLDGPLERRRLRFRAKLGVVRRGLPATAGFGLVCFALVSIPLLNLVAIPLCVAGGTLLFCERLQTKL
jgi:CysZ protein